MGFLRDREFIPLVFMARPLTLASRLSAIHRELSASAEPAYSPAMLCRLFQLTDRPVQSLLRLMPRRQAGRCVVVLREDLLAFVAAAIDAEDLRSHIAGLRQRPPVPLRQIPRTFDADDFGVEAEEPTPGPAVQFDRGRFELRFGSREEAAVLLEHMAEMLNHHDFEEVFCRPRPSARGRSGAAAVPASGSPERDR